LTFAIVDSKTPAVISALIQAGADVEDRTPDAGLL